jgi:hypothetical protein
MFVPEIEKYNVDQMEKSINEFYKINWERIIKND